MVAKLFKRLETTCMSNGEYFDNVFPSDEEYAPYSVHIVDTLKMASIALGSSPRWSSADGTRNYMAQPLTFGDGDPIQPNDHIPFVAYAAYMDFARDQILNTWVIYALEAIDNSSELIMRKYFMDTACAVAVGTPMSPHMFTGGSQAEFLMNAYGVESANAIPKPFSVLDFANVDNALHDLKTQTAVEKALRTKEDLRTIRTNRRLITSGPRANENMFEATKPQWWHIWYDGVRSYAIFAPSAEDAVLDLEEHFSLDDRTIDEMHIPYSVEAHGLTNQNILAGSFGEREFVRLMPYSLIEYTTDLDTATDEQRKAFVRAERILGEGRVLG